MVPTVGNAFTSKRYLAGFPLNTTIGSTTTPISKSYNTASAFGCDTSPTPLVYFLHDSLTLLCGQKVTQLIIMLIYDGVWFVFVPKLTPVIIHFNW